MTIAIKELRDHWRDYRTLRSTAVLALMGPGVVWLVSHSDQSHERGSALVMWSLLSVFALVTAFAAGMDVAMDATAGERERHSMVPLLLNPISRADMLVGKWVAVAVFGLAALGVNIVGVMLVLKASAPAFLASHTRQLGVWTGCGLLPLVFLGAALNVCVAIRCRTAKEAHTALRGLTFLPMMVGMFLVFFPAWVGRLWCVVPLVGQQMLAGPLMEATSVARALILAVSTTAATLLVLFATIRSLTRDEILLT